MNDKLIQALEASALAATPGDWTADSNFGFSVQCYRTGLDRLLATVNGPNAENDTQFIAVASPQNILRVLAERETDKLLIAELQDIRAAAEKLVRCKGRYHSEQNYRALAALFSVNTPDLPPLDNESRQLTVNFPGLPILGSNAEWYQGFYSGAEGMLNECKAAVSRDCAAAGITLVVGGE